MTQFPNPIAEALYNASQTVPDEQVDPSMRAQRDALDEVIGKHRDAARGVDALVDRSIVDLERRSVDLENTVRDVRRVRAQAEQGAIPQAVAEKVVAEQRERIALQTNQAIDAARKAFEIGRERLVDELLPPVTRTVEAGQAGGEILDVLARHGEDVARGLQTALEEALRGGDDLVVRMIAGEFGRRQFLKQGGTEEAWQGLRRQFFSTIAKGVDPKSPAGKRWRIVLDNDLERFLAAAGGRLRWQLERMK